MVEVIILVIVIASTFSVLLVGSLDNGTADTRKHQ